MKNLLEKRQVLDQHISKFFKTTFGIRTVKTAIATALALYIAQSFDLRIPMMAGLSAIVTMKSSIFDSYKTSINRLLSTTIGGILGITFHIIGFVGFLPMMIGIIFVINLCNYFKWKDSITLAVMVFVMLMMYNPTPPNNMPYWEYALHRLFDTFVGLTIGFMINYFIFPPNRGEFIMMTYVKSLKEMEDSLIAILKGEKPDVSSLIKDIASINTEFDNIQKDKKLGYKYNFKISKIVKLNEKFFSGIGIITHFAEDGRVPILSGQNKEGLNNYFGAEIEIDTENFTEEFESAFNYYLDDLLEIMTNIKVNIESLNNEIPHKE